MKKIEKIEHFLWDYGGLIKIVLVAFWIFWATQFIGPLVGTMKEDIRNMKNRDIQKEMRLRLDLAAFTQEKVKQAKLQGTSYSPQKYFADLIEIDAKGDSDGISGITSSEVIELQQLSMDNLRRGIYTEKDVNEGRRAYEEWNGERVSHREETFQKAKTLGWSGAAGKVGHWFWIFYIRSMLLAFLLYLVRMADGKGILETILADKKKFILAVIGWIFYLFRYPNNVIREIVVEAELRRIGNLFRPLNLFEKAKVKEVANSSYYKNWLVAFQRKNTIRFQKGLLVALFVTVLLYLFGPFLEINASSVSVKREKQHFLKEVVLNKGDPNSAKADLRKNQNNAGQEKFCPEEWGMIETKNVISPLLICFWIHLEKEFLKIERLIKKIDHIPIDYLVSKVTNLTLNQIVGGIFFRHNGGRNEKVINICGHVGAFAGV